MSEHNNWYEKLVGDATERAVAMKSGITTSTLNRQLKAGVLSAENVILIARAYGSNPVAALATTGYIKVSEANENLGDIAQLLPDRKLIAELARRIGVDVSDLMSVKENEKAPIRERRPHIVSSDTRDDDLIRYNRETMAAYPRKERLGDIGDYEA